MCLLIHMLRMSNDAVRIRFILFSLKDNANRWMYGLKIGSIKSWDCSTDIFLKRCFATSKAIRLGNEILSIIQLEHEPFWRYMNRFKELFFHCPRHGLKKWNLWQIAFEGLDVSTRTMIESMCESEFLWKNVNGAWYFLRI